MADLELVAQGHEEEVVQVVGSNNRSREAGGETEKQETDASQICHNLPIVISLPIVSCALALE